LGDILALTGEHERARHAYEAASARVPREEGLWQVRLRCQIANTWRSQHRHGEAGRAYRAALQQLGPAPTGDEAAWWPAWLDVQLARADMLYFSSSLSEMSQLCDEIGAIVEAHGSLEQRANYHSALVMLDNRLGRFRPSSQTLERVARTLALAEESGDQHLINHKRFSLGFSLLWYGDLEGAEGSLSTALAQAERRGNLPLRDQSLAYLTITHRLGGNVPQVQRFAPLALEVATAEQNPVYIGVARANLAWLQHRAGDRTQAVRHATAALERWRPLSYPMEWLARWPLLADRLFDNDVSGAIEQARSMLDPAQQRLPDVLATALEQAIEAWDRGRAKSVRGHLAEASSLAEEQGYL
jgi:tetratricopeptide (TPR) repeat protein